MRLLSCSNVINVPVRYSRGSMIEYRRRRSLLKEYRVQPNKAIVSESDNVFEDMVSDIKNVVPVHSKKTSITIDILGEETYPQLTEWRRHNLLRRARRVLPLPISLTTDEQVAHVWKQKYIANLERDNRQSSAEKQLESVPEIVKMLAKDNPEILKKMDLYENFEKIQQNVNAHLEKISKNKVLDMNSLNRLPYFPFESALQKAGESSRSLSEDGLNDKSNGIEHYNDKVDNKLMDEEMNNFMKHHELVQYLATNLQKVPHYEYKPEVEGWASQQWLRDYGTADAKIPPTDIPCSGCGAHLHCTSTSIPGFMPSEKFSLYTKEELRAQFCQRCDFLKRYNVALTVNASEEDYPRLISEIKSKDCLVIILVDLLDFPCSVWPGIINLVGEKQKLFIVGNKADLLPKDDKFYLERVKQSLKLSLRNAGIDKTAKIRDVSLISAKTGHGIENLATKLLRDMRKGQDIYLLGCTNSGKSTLFNALMQTDLCALRDQDLMSRATTSIWPGTTLNLLKFPVRNLAAWELTMRLNRLNLFEKKDIAERKLKWTMHRQSQAAQPFAMLQNRIGSTFRKAPPMDIQEDHPLKSPENSSAKPFNPDQKRFADCSYLHDTPGALYKDQILNLLTTEELLKTIPREIITPRTFTLRPHMTLFLAGLGRIDVVHARSHVWLTVFASHYLPVNIVYTEQARRFYDMHCGTEMLAVPFGGMQRLEQWPRLMPKEFTIKGTGWEKSAADIVLSSAGWVAVTDNKDSECVVRAFTPAGRGIILRDPPALPFAVNLKGKRLINSPCFENKLYTVDQLVEGSFPRKFGRTDARLNPCEGDVHISEERIRKAAQFLEN